MNEITLPFLKVPAGGEAICHSAEVDLSEKSVWRPLRVKPLLHRSGFPHRQWLSVCNVSLSAAHIIVLSGRNSKCDR